MTDKLHCTFKDSLHLFLEHGSQSPHPRAVRSMSSLVDRLSVCLLICPHPLLLLLLLLRGAAW